MKKFNIILALVLFFSNYQGNSQNIIKHNNDTLITITPENVKTINSIIIDLESSKDIIRLQKNIIKTDSIMLIEKDSVIKYQNNIFSRKESHYVNSLNNLEKNLNSEKKKRRIWTSLLSFVAVFLGILAIK